MLNSDPIRAEAASVLGYSLKHTLAEVTRRTTAALTEWSIDPRELGVMRVVAGNTRASQQDVARLLGIDRTTMVAFADALEEKGLVSRRPLLDDRRRNVLELTERGREVFEHAVRAERDAEENYLACLGRKDGCLLRELLRSLVIQSPPPPCP